MIDTHWQLRIFFLKDTAKFYDICTSTKMTCLSKISIWENVTRTQMNEMCTRSKLLCHLYNIIICTCRKTSCTEGQSIMLIWNCIQEPLNIFFCTYNTWKAQHLNRWIVWVNTHIHVAFLTNRHDCLKEIFHVRTKLCLINTFIQFQEITEFLNWCFIILAEITRNKTLCLNNNCLNKIVFLFWSHCLCKSITLFKNITTLPHSCWELELCPLLTRTLTL